MKSKEWMFKFEDEFYALGPIQYKEPKEEAEVLEEIRMTYFPMEVDISEKVSVWPYVRWY